MSAPVLARVVIGHNEDDDYHEWVDLNRTHVRANSLGVPNPRMVSAQWRKWECNNPECPAWAIVHDGAVVALIEAAS